MKKILFPILSLLFITSCDYENINTNKLGVSDDEIKIGGLSYGAPFMKMQQLVIPIGSPTQTTGPGNDLQNTDLISSGNYIGYFGNNNNWNFNLESNWNFVDNRMNYAYQNFYSNIFRPWNDIRKQTINSEEPYDQQVFALSQIVKITAWLRATDVFGPIVYKKAGDGDIAPSLDSQEDVYKNMLEDLSNAVETLKKTESRVMSNYDLIYDGNVSKWIKFANSIMLRMAVRSHFVNPELAQLYIGKALDPVNGGVIEKKEDEAKIQSSDKMPLLNSMIASVVEYGETRMGTTIWAYLKGYNDPRIEQMFTKGTYYSKTDFLPIAPTNKASKKNGANTAETASKPKVDNNSPLYWFRASETYFLKAEAALYGLISGDARSYYEAGVNMSFEEFGVSSASYLNSTNKPSNMERNEYIYNASTWDTYTCIISTGNTSPKWDDYNSESTLSEKEQQLQKIITQKYIALYPNAVEAWTEYRRTGYPYLMKPYDNQAYTRIEAEEDCLVPERFKFAPSEYSSNPNMNKVPQLLGGNDVGATKLWWVRKDRPKQPKL